MNPEQLHDQAQQFRKGYKNALLQLPSYTQACAEMVFEGKEIRKVVFQENKVNIEVRSEASEVNDTLGITTTTADFETFVLIYSNTGPINGEPNKNAWLVYEKTPLRPVRKAEFENQGLVAKGIDAIEPIKNHIEEVEWIGLQDFCAK